MERELLNIHGPHAPALSAVSAQPGMDGWGYLFLAFKKRLSHKNIVVHHENISDTFHLCQESLIYQSYSIRAGERGRGEEKDHQQTFTAWGVFSLYLCVTKATLAAAGVSGHSFRESY